MRILRNALIALLFSSTVAMAEPASESSIKQLLTATQAQKLIDSMRAQFDSLMNKSVQQVLDGKTPTPRQKQAITNMKDKMVVIMKEELEWEKLEPMYVRLYKESFTEEEVSGMLSFYKSKAGQAVVYKMPALMQKTMQELQKMIFGMTPKMEKIKEEFISEMKAASN